MSVINVLDKQTANLIAAGEVVDRPSAVAKELLENAIDAGGTQITIEIKNGGSSLIRVTDNGKGMSPDDVKSCVLRHATSKIHSAQDLEGITTLGFRGEALAAISSVSRFQVISKQPNAQFGTSMAMEGESTLSFDEVGCPDGTTITVRDIFFNVPARRKFLKKDATETAYITQYVERIAISHPNIALKFIVDSKIKFSTPGSGELKDSVYSVFGREFLEAMTEIENNTDNIKIRGMISKPQMSKINRNHQIIFINNRLIRSRIISYAVEDAYKSYIMTDRYPAFILFIDLSPYSVDINVHPTKLEVRFSDEATIREKVYFTVKNKLESLLNPIKEDFKIVQQNLDRQQVINAFAPLERTQTHVQEEIQIQAEEINMPQRVDPSLFSFVQATPSNSNALIFKDNGFEKNGIESQGTIVLDENENKKFESSVPVTKYVNYRGIVFNTYIIGEYNDSMYIIDKHAAHERILYEQLKAKKSETGVQQLADVRVLQLSLTQYECAIDNIQQLTQCGFELEVFGENSFAMRGVPTEFLQITVSECEKILLDMINDIMHGKNAKLTKEQIFDKTLYTAACKAATKAGYPDDEQSYIWLINKLFEYENVFCCPHGRPIIIKYTKSQIEKMFNRT